MKKEGANFLELRASMQKVQEWRFVILGEMEWTKLNGQSRMECLAHTNCEAARTQK